MILVSQMLGPLRYLVTVEELLPLLRSTAAGRAGVARHKRRVDMLPIQRESVVEGVSRRCPGRRAELRCTSESLGFHLIRRI
jgi:hypothetical protein